MDDQGLRLDRTKTYYDLKRRLKAKKIEEDAGSFGKYNGKPSYKPDRKLQL